MRWLLIILAAATILGVPEADSQGTRRETNSAQSSAIEGRVLNAVTGEPLRKVDLILRRADVSPNAHSPASYTTSTDESGRFVMGDVEPGQYRLLAARSGFVSMEYGSRGPVQAGVTLSVEAGRPPQDIVFRLTPHAVIAGRIRDVEGEPLANVQVQAMRYRSFQGGKRLSSFGRATTNDLGEYRIAGLAPGQYYLSASLRPPLLFGLSVDSSGALTTAEDCVPTFYPGTADATLSVPVEVTAGSELRNLDFALSKAATVRITGRVINPIGGSPGIVTVILAPTDRSSAWGTNRTFVTNPQGEFDLRGVTPGTYTFVASMFRGGTYTTAKKEVDARNNVEDLTVTLNPGVDLKGAVLVEGSAIPNLTSVRISLLPAHGGPFLIPLPTTEVKQDGTFTLSNVSPDNYNLVAFELPDGYYVKSIRLGDYEVLDAGLDLSGSADAPITIVLSGGAGEIAGAVQTAQQRAAIGAPVVLAPSDAKRHDQIQYYRTVTTDQYGRFLLRNVVPGSYKLFAWEYIEDGAVLDSDFMKPVEEVGQPVLIQENSRTSARLKLIPADQSRRE